MRKSPGDSSTEFLNVDLDIESSQPLDPLVAAFGDKAFVMFVGREGRRYTAHLELAGSGWKETPDQVIKGLVSLIRRLPKPAAKLWTSASRREFNIGRQAWSEPPAFELKLRPQTVAAIASVDGTVIITVYAPKQPRRNRQKLR